MLGGVGLAAQQSPVHPGLIVQNAKQPGVGLYGIGNSGNKMIDLVDQILYKKGFPNQGQEDTSAKLRQVTGQLNEIAAHVEKKPDLDQHNLYYTQGKNLHTSKACLMAGKIKVSG